MKTSPAFLLLVNALLAIGLTVISFQYVQPKSCYNFCDPSYVIPCPKGSCYFGDQKAGWPIPIFVDAPGGGSPTSGWGLLGPEDPPIPLPLIVDVLFYSILIWIILFTIQFFRHQAFSLKLFLASLSLNALLGACLWIFFLVFSFTFGFHFVGRGYRDSVYVETSKDKDIQTAMGFMPTVPIHLDEVIEYYGEPDDVWFTSNGIREGTTTGMMLYWDAVPVFVELPQIADETYPVNSNTRIERILFCNDQDVVAIAGEPMSGEKTAWRGYGDYQP